MVAIAVSSTTHSNLCARYLALPIWTFFSSTSKSTPRRYCGRQRYFSWCRKNATYCRHTSLPGRGAMQLLRNCSDCHGSICSHFRWLPCMHCSSVAGQISSQKPIEGDTIVEYRHGLPVLVLTLPSRGERCEFALRPVTETVSDICEYVRNEDNAGTNVAIYTPDGAKIAGSTSIEHLMQDNFHIRLNDKVHLVRPPKRSFLTTEHLKQLDDVKALVANLHIALNTDEHYLRYERELLAKMEAVQREMEPLEAQKKVIAAESDRRTSRVLWIGLALMGVQLGALARLTWFEYSWDIMEPVTYFTTYTAVIGGYAYYVATRVQYEYPDAKERMIMNKFYNLCRKKGFDVTKYNQLSQDIHELKEDLDRIRRSPNFPHRDAQPGTITIKRKTSTQDPPKTPEQSSVETQDDHRLS